MTIPTLDLTDDAVRLDVEAELCKLDGVESVRVVGGTHRPIDELHALVAPRRSAKRVARDLQTLLATRFDLEVDRRVISIVQLDGDVGERLRNAVPRVSLDGVTVSVRDRETTVEVDVVDDDRLCTGRVGVPSGGSVAQAAATAAIEALSSCLGTVALHMVETRLLTIADHRVVVTVVEARAGRDLLVLSGSAVVRLGEADAAARAVLDATNRLSREDD